MNSTTQTMQFMIWASSGATLLYCFVLIGGMAVAFIKMREHKSPSRWLLAALACSFASLAGGGILRFAMARYVTSTDFATYSIAISIAQTLAATFAIVLFVIAVYSDRNVPLRSDREEFLSGQPTNRGTSGGENPFESPQS